MGEFSPDWPHGHQTRDGRKARIICRDRRAETFPIVALIETEYGENVICCTDEGLTPGSTDRDCLINSPAPKKVWEGWANIFPSRVETWATKAMADRYSCDQATGDRRIACIQFRHEYSPGEGL